MRWWRMRWIGKKGCSWVEKALAKYPKPVPAEEEPIPPELLVPDEQKDIEEDEPTPVFNPFAKKE